MPRLKSALLVSISILIVVALGLMLREYILLKRIENVLRAPINPKIDDDTVRAAKPVKLVQNLEANPEGTKYVATVRFAAFKQMVESNPQIISSWGRFYWKVLGDTPALCIKSLSAANPLLELKASPGDCVTHLDGETVNQPMRNLAIWVGLGRRESLKIVLLRQGMRIAYELHR